MKKRFIVLLVILPFLLGAQTGTGCWRMVSSGNNFTLAIKNDGTLWGWGLNGNRLGLGYFSATENLPIQVGNANDWLVVSSGENHALALKTNGTLWSWGNGQFGQLGNGVFNSATFTVTQVGTANDWVAIAAGTGFSLALKNNGTLWSWGLNSTGQLGQNNTTNLNLPTQVGIATDWLKIEAGDQHALALKTNNSLWSWGNNTTGQLGDGSFNTSLIPIPIASALTFIEISAGFDHSMAIESGLTLYTWGNNTNGQLGDGTNTTSNVPIPISFSLDGLPSSCIAISAGQTHSLIIRNNATLWSAGFNNQGQLAQGNLTNLNTFIQVGSGTNWTQISAGFVHSHAMDSSADLWSAGRGIEGEMGIATNVNSSNLVNVACPTSLDNSDFQSHQGYKITPNPAHHFLKLQGDVTQIQALKLYTLTGQLILESVNLPIQETELNFPLPDIAAGSYILHIITPSKTYQKKIILE
ncbi:RCC1 domain-containing protein [Flavobacterium stagni]|uniref:T9SS type A sorting domain-containing protein n=1 Tax=Flavobacterium stagni TaxID=2506421 RepID=A0A4Q1K6W4_9FLAO|nr:T9SS type A sorting domain-containing protein [Flavobacterium stagni]RXR21807.1 T9SS type A sorting domain-containing protein [Flavobacterium stagni]